MSGMKNIANAVANDPKSANELGMSASEAKLYVDNPGNKSAAKPAPKGK